MRGWRVASCPEPGCFGLVLASDVSRDLGETNAFVGLFCADLRDDEIEIDRRDRASVSMTQSLYEYLDD
jgi:hypothetical protein